MKCKALLDGFDGNKSYVPGDTLEGDSEHVRMLLFNNAAEPLDKEAKDFVSKMDDLDDDTKNRLNNETVRDNVLEMDVPSEGVAKRRGGAKKKAATKKRSR